jgi:CO/xanthine dehydrogenase FAD-binding subunit
MPKRPRAYYRPESLDEALRLLRQPETVPLAGGTTLLAGDAPVAVVDLQALGLATITLAADGSQKRLTLGAMARLADISQYLEENGRGLTPAPLLRRAIHRHGPNTFRNAATIGGVIATRPADSELLAALLALEAELTVLTPAEQRLSLRDYLAAEATEGLITTVSLPWQAGRGESDRVGRTPADTPIVSVTAWRAQSGPIRLAATGIAERPTRLVAAEMALAEQVDEAAIAAAAAAAQAQNRHSGDFRGSAGYRGEMVAVLTARVVRALLARLGSSTA